MAFRRVKTRLFEMFIMDPPFQSPATGQNTIVGLLLFSYFLLCAAEGENDMDWLLDNGKGRGYINFIERIR
ncbi:hypothetical protein EDC14_103011 [Hydrogenispora ethanolica]|uniref:Uncharacterized protein n=1 Tax=Hydrogenispora ethanolica TaxID=1082276 RepID=A0A4R1R8M9_HYDET|nr:hypothetical protein EDC14_103011 [Hydrogenispora ethanolica]